MSVVKSILLVVLLVIVFISIIPVDTRARIVLEAQANTTNTKTVTVGNLIVRYCLNESIEANAIFVSPSSKVIVVSQNYAPLHCLVAMMKLARQSRMILMEPSKQQIILSVLQRTLNTKLGDVGFGSRQGVIVKSFYIYSNGVVFVTVESPKPLGLGRDFASMVAFSLAKILGQYGYIVTNVGVIYASPHAKLAAARISELVNEDLANVTAGLRFLAVGLDGGIPVLEIDRAVLERIPLNKLVEMVEARLPKDSWAVIVLYEEPPRVRQLAENTTSTSIASVHELENQSSRGYMGQVNESRMLSTTVTKPVSTVIPTGSTHHISSEDTIVAKSKPTSWKPAVLLATASIVIILGTYIVIRRRSQGN